MDYPYEQLDPERFQKLCQALLTREHKNVQCFPVAQPDGGRDAVVFGGTSESKEFVIFQVKFVRQPVTISDARSWLFEILNSELPKITALTGRGAKQFVLITNIPGTAHLGVGSIDRAQSLLDSLPVPAFCWWRDDLNRRLDNAWELKWVFPELMTGPDLIHAIIEGGLADDQARRTAAIRAFIIDQYSKDSEVKFKQVELQNGLLDLYIDVPIGFPRNAPSRKEFLELRMLFQMVLRDFFRQQYVRAEATEQDLAREEIDFFYAQREEEGGLGAATLLLHPRAQQYLKRIVLEGAPGQGKSTITQYICQVHRMRVLGMEELGALPAHHRTCPVRIPIRIDLRDLAIWLDKKNPFVVSDEEGLPADWQKSLESFMAAQVRYQSGGIDFSVADLLAVARLSSLLIVFDGLDEVAQIKRRQEVVDQIRDGVARLEVNASSLQVIVTSRPAAFANSPGLPPDLFPYFELASLTRPLIDEYTEKWIKARRLDSSDARDVRRILKDKLDAPHMRDLARNPMQLAILLSLIHTRGVSLPDKRTALYDSYVELFFNREAEKSAIVRDHRDLLISIHRYLAWTLHVQAETGRGAGSIRADELEKLLRKYLEIEGHDVMLVADLFTGMVERVVAIVSRVQGTFEFEVQPLREYFAARFLYETAPYSPPGNEKRGTKLDRFDALARNFYWLNVTRFYAGCYSVGELSSLIAGLEDLAESEDFRYLSHPRVLAAMLLSDWVFAQHPKSVREVMALILDGMGMRFVLAASGRRGSTNTPLVLPRMCGREELLNRGMDLLNQKLAREFAFDVVELINQNRGASDVYSRWLNEVRKNTGEIRTSWLEYGMWMGLLGRLSEAELDEVVSDKMLDSRRILILLRGHLTTWLTAEKNRAASVVLSILERPITRVTGLRGKQLLDMFSLAIEPGQYANALGSASSMPLSEIIDRRGIGTLSSKPSETVPDPSLAACQNVLVVANRESQKASADWATSISPWNAVVEEVRGIWGEELAVYHLAVVAAGIRSTTEQCADTPALFDKSAPLCHRVRYARLRAGTPSWWSKQLDNIQHRLDAMLACEVLFTWGSPSTIAQLAPKLDAVVRALSDPDWMHLYHALEDTTSILRMYGLVRPISIDPNALIRLSERTLVAIGIRCDERTAAELYDLRLKKYKGRDTAVLQFCQVRAIEGVLSGGDDWREDLSIVERCYALGASVPRQSYYYVGAEMGSYKLPLELVAEVVRKPDRYPAALVAIAEARQRAEIGKRVTPVGTVAKVQGWFENA